MKPAELRRAIVAHLAAALTPAQREALLWLPADGSERVTDRKVKGDRRLETPLYGLGRKAVTPGVDAILVRCGHEWNTSGRTKWTITPLGLTVRAILAAEVPKASASGEGVASSGV